MYFPVVKTIKELAEERDKVDAARKASASDHSKRSKEIKARRESLRVSLPARLENMVAKFRAAKYDGVRYTPDLTISLNRVVLTFTFRDPPDSDVVSYSHQTGGHTKRLTTAIDVLEDDSRLEDFLVNEFGPYLSKMTLL